MTDHFSAFPSGTDRQPWNKGKLIGAKPPLRLKHIWAIRRRLQLARRKRDLALFNLAIDSKLRGCDLVSLTLGGLAPRGYSVDRATIRQHKTGRPVRFELTELRATAKRRRLSEVAGREPGGRSRTGVSVPERRRALMAFHIFPAASMQGWLPSKEPLVPGRHITRRLLIQQTHYGTHSPSRTKATMIYKRTGNLRAVQILLGHTRIESTVRYLGVEIDDALAIAEQTDV